MRNAMSFAFYNRIRWATDHVNEKDPPARVLDVYRKRYAQPWFLIKFVTTGMVTISP